MNVTENIMMNGMINSEVESFFPDVGTSTDPTESSESAKLHDSAHGTYHLRLARAFDIIKEDISNFKNRMKLKCLGQSNWTICIPLNPFCPGNFPILLGGQFLLP